MKKWLITVHSQKGGVGKTLLSLYLARRLADSLEVKKYSPKIPVGTKEPYDGMKRKVVLIDADLTGTSLAHILKLEAPKIREDAFYNVDETNEILKEISPSHIQSDTYPSAKGLRLAFLNHALFLDPYNNKNFLKANNNKLSANKLLWCLDTSDSKTDPKLNNVDFGQLRIIPSSGFSGDVGYCVPHIYKEDVTSFLGHRLLGLVCWLLYERFKENFDIVIIDTPPVLWGMSRAVLRLHESLKRKYENEKHNTKYKNEPEVGNLALMVASADTQDIVGLTQGIDSLCMGDKQNRIISPENANKGDYKLNISNVRLVINRVPVGAPELPTLAKAPGHYAEKVEKYLNLQSDCFKEDKKGKTLWEKDSSGLKEPIPIELDTEALKMFTSESITLRPIDNLEGFYGKVKGYIEDAEKSK